MNRPALQEASLRPEELATATPVNLSRRGFLGALGLASGGLVLGVGLPLSPARAEGRTEAMAPGTRVPAFLELRPDGSAHLLSPFVEGGQGIFTGMVQIVAEELDLDPARFTVANAPADDQYKVLSNGLRLTGGSMSTRMGIDTMRRLGALARGLLLEEAADQLGVSRDTLTTEPGVVIHQASGQRLPYGDLAQAAWARPIPDPESIQLRNNADFRWIGQSFPRVDAYDKSTGKVVYNVDMQVEGMVHAAIRHAPRLGMTLGRIRNDEAVRAMRGVQSLHSLPGAVGVVAQHWWDANRAAQALQIDWLEAEAAPMDGPLKGARIMPADFSTAGMSATLAAQDGAGKDAETRGEARARIAQADRVISGTYESQYLHHAQLEPPSAIARFNADGSLDLWMPNQSPEMFRSEIAEVHGLEEAQIRIHSPMLGGFFGRHFLSKGAGAYHQAIVMARETGKPVKLIWSREEEFLRDGMRPMAVVRMRGTVGADGMPDALELVLAGEGAGEARRGHDPDKVDYQAVEGLTEKPYAIPHLRIAQNYVESPNIIAPWRSVGHSANDFFFEAALDELADAGGQDPFEMRRKLSAGEPRLLALLEAVADLSGGWTRGPFTAPDGTRRARGVATAAPFGSLAAAIAEVSVAGGRVVVHHIWQAVDPGMVVNPALVKAQVESATALGLSQVLVEHAQYAHGEPVGRNYDLYPVLPPQMMPEVHVRILESGAPMGGVGEIGVPAVPPAVVNALSTLMGQRYRRMPLSTYSFSA